MKVFAFIATVLMPVLALGQEFKILSWNIELGDSEPRTILNRLHGLNDKVDLLALSEVRDEVLVHTPIAGEFGVALFNDHFTWCGSTGSKNNRLLFAFDKSKANLDRVDELKDFDGAQVDDRIECAPLVATFHTRGRVFCVVNIHLARNEDSRNQQAQALVDWAGKQSLPIVAVGDFNMDYDYETNKGNEAFSIMQRDGVFKWIKPGETIDTNWTDRNSDGKDDLPNVMQDLVFVAGSAKSWDIKTEVIVREGDFPDDEKTSSHRPILTTLIVK